jgi:hypothetical protein
MEQIAEAELERLMRVREVMLQAISKKITWWQAAEILGVSARTMRRWKWHYDNFGFRGIRQKAQDEFVFHLGPAVNLLRPLRTE